MGLRRRVAASCSLHLVAGRRRCRMGPAASGAEPRPAAPCQAHCSPLRPGQQLQLSEASCAVGPACGPHPLHTLHTLHTHHIPTTPIHPSQHTTPHPRHNWRSRMSEVLEGRLSTVDAHSVAKEAVSKAEDLKAELIMAQVGGVWVWVWVCVGGVVWVVVVVWVLMLVALRYMHSR